MPPRRRFLPVPISETPGKACSLLHGAVIVCPALEHALVSQHAVVLVLHAVLIVHSILLVHAVVLVRAMDTILFVETALLA